MRPTFSGSFTMLPKMRQKLAKSPGYLFNVLAIVLLQLVLSVSAYAVAITSATLTCTQTMTATSSCVNTGGQYASGWTGGGSKYWEYTVSTVGYSAITFQATTSSSGTGPTSGQVWVNYGTGFVQVTGANYSVSTSCGSTGLVNLSAFNAAVNNNANLKVRLIMSGASASGGTNRVSGQPFAGTSSGCTGTPTAGNITTPTTQYCGSGAALLTLNGATSGTGITYQWQVSTTSPSSGFSNISGANGLSYNTGTLTNVTASPVNYYYRVVVTCTPASTSATTTAQTITINPLPTTPVINTITGQPKLVSNTFTATLATGSGGSWTSSNSSVASIDVSTGNVTVNFGGTTFIKYTVNNGFGCESSDEERLDAVWPNTLALYAGYNGTSTDVIEGDANVVTTNIDDENFGTASACGTGGLSGLTMPTSVTSYIAATGPRVVYKINATTGNAINIFQIHARARVSSTGPTKARLAYSTDGVNWTADAEVNLTDGSCGASANNWYWTTGGPTLTGITGDFYVAVYPYAPGSNTGTFQINTLEVYGTVSSSTPCAGAPAGGTITQLFPQPICDSGFRTLGLTHPGGVGISYQWQESPNGTTGWTNISGATNVFYTTPTLLATKYYRVKVICANGPDSSYSDTADVIVTPRPVVSITNLRVAIAVGSPWDFNGTAPIAGDTIRWTSNYVSTSPVDSATGVINSGAGPKFPAKDVVVTYSILRNGCFGSAKDTFDVIDSSAIAYYLGSNGNSNGTTPLQNVTATQLVKNGFGTGTSCGKGGLSGMTNAPASFSTSNTQYVSFKISPNGGDFGAISDVRVTLRSSGSGPGSFRLAYRPYNLGVAGNWVDNGADLGADFDDCGYSMDWYSWFDGTSTPLSFTPLIPGVYADSIEFAIFPFDATSATGTFQVNSISVRGRVAPLCGNEVVIDSVGGGEITGETLCQGNHDVELNPAAYAQTYWSVVNPNDPAKGYFTEASIKGANAGELNVVAAATGVEIVALGYDAANSCLDIAITGVDYGSTGCSPKPGRPNSISNVEATGVRFYPNPVTTVLNIEAHEAVNVIIMSIDGKVVAEQKNASAINISNLVNGMYIIKATNNQNELVQTAKFIKQ